MKDFTDEQLRYLCDLIINAEGVTKPTKRADIFNMIDSELTRREDIASLDDDCLSCKL
jgi:hypothetical protein